MNSPFEPGITLVVMVRDDAERLDRCLASAKDAADKVVVMDTGSKDGSLDVAKKHGAETFSIEWPDAFDEALNQLLDRVRTEWTLRLDSDEWLEPEAAQATRRVVEEPNAFLVSLMRRDIREDGSAVMFEQNRLWRTHPEMRYEGAVHEQFWPEALVKAGEGKSMLKTDIVIQHDGFAQGMSRDKIERNLRLLRKELELRPGRMFYEVCLADTLAEAGDPEANVVQEEMVQRILRSNRAPEELVVAIVVGRALASVPDDQLHSPRTGKLLKFAHQWLGEFPAILWAAAGVERRKGNLREALETLRQLDAMGRSGKFNRAIGFDMDIVREGCWAGILDLAHALGRKELIAPYQNMLAQSMRARAAQQANG